MYPREKSGKSKGILIHTSTDGNGLPLANRTTLANGSERDQVIPLLDSVKVKMNRSGKSRKRVKILAADKGNADLMSQWQQHDVHNAAFRK